MFRRWKKNRTGDKVVPYSQLAEIYDYIMRHVDYVQWGDYIQAIYARFEVEPATILELACGTGSLASILTTRGYHVTGIDLSEAMVTIACRKALQQEQSIVFMQGDMTLPPVAGPFDSVLCLYDSVNYLMDLEAMRRMMEKVQARLHPNGLFIFDACTEINSQRYFNRQTDQEGTDDFSYIRRSEYIARERVQVNEFQLLLKRGDHYDHHFERHEQRIYPITQILETCRTAGFNILGAFNGFTFTPATEKSNRVHFVLSAPATA